MAKILYAAGSYAHIKSFHTDYIRALQNEGHEVVVMANGEGADIDIAFEKKMLSPRNLLCQIKLKRILKREKFDAILLNTTLAAFNIRMALPRRNRPRVVNLMHGYMFRGTPEGLKEKIFLFVEKFLRKKTDSVIVMNEEDLISAKKYRLTSGEIIKIRGMGATVRPEEKNPEEIRASLGDEDGYAIVFTGELSKTKNQSQLISILPELKKSIPNAVLWLLGVGGAQEELKTLAKEQKVEDSVRFVGFVKNPTDYIRAADLYVAPSKKEGLPFNVIEALGVQTPIIVSDIKGHRDLIEDGVSGLIYDLTSDSDLLKKILAIYGGEVTLDEERQKATYENYSKDQVFEETLGVMKRLMGV